MDRKLLKEAKEYLKSRGYRLIENAGVSVESVVRALGNNFDLNVETININGSESYVFAGNGKPGYIKVLEGDDGNVYITFLDDAGVPSGKPAAKITSLEDIAECL